MTAPLSRLPEDQPVRLDGSIHVADPEPAAAPPACDRFRSPGQVAAHLPAPDNCVRCGQPEAAHATALPAYAALPYVTLGEPRVGRLINGCVHINLAGDLKIWVSTAEQCRDIIAAFAKAAELLAPSESVCDAATFGTESEPGR